MCLSIAHGGLRCAGHCRESLAEALGAYAARWPGGPEPTVLVAAETGIGMLHGHAALARQWSRTADTTADRQRAAEYAAATQDRLDAIRHARSTGAGGAGAALTAEEHARWEAAGHNAELSEVRAARFDDLADEAMWDGDETAAGRHAWMAARCRESAALARQEQVALLERRTPGSGLPDC